MILKLRFGRCTFNVKRYVMPNKLCKTKQLTFPFQTKILSNYMSIIWKIVQNQSTKSLSNYITNTFFKTNQPKWSIEQNSLSIYICEIQCTKATKIVTSYKILYQINLFKKKCSLSSNIQVVWTIWNIWA